MITDALPIRSAFAALISSMHLGSRQSFWYRVDDRTSDGPSNVQPNIKPGDDDETKQKAIKDADSKKQQLKILNLSSLCQQTSLLREQYHNMLLTIGLLSKFAGGYRVNIKGWNNFLESLDIDAEFSDCSIWKIASGGRRYYVRIGPKNDGEYIKKIEDQISLEVERKPPRFRGTAVRKKLRDALFADDGGDSSDSESDGTHNNNQSQQHSTINTSDDTLSTLTQFGIDELTDTKLQALIGELVNVQKLRKEKSSSQIVSSPTAAASPSVSFTTAAAVSPTEPAQQSSPEPAALTTQRGTQPTTLRCRRESATSEVTPAGDNKKSSTA